MDHTTLLYNPLYATFGIRAVIPQAARTDASQNCELDTVCPSAIIPENDLEKAGFPLAELDRGLLTYGGSSWRVEAHAVQPGPDKPSGEVVLYLSEDTDA